jgi:hypothetical protein
MGKRRKKTTRRNLLGSNVRIAIFDHVIDQYIDRTGVSRYEAETTIRDKFKNSKLTKFLGGNYEMRKEVSGDMNKRLTFICQKQGNLFKVRTCYLQGSRNNWWKQNHYRGEKECQELVST